MYGDVGASSLARRVFLRGRDGRSRTDGQDRLILCQWAALAAAPNVQVAALQGGSKGTASAVGRWQGAMAAAGTHNVHELELREGPPELSDAPDRARADDAALGQVLERLVRLLEAALHDERVSRLGPLEDARQLERRAEDGRDVL